jgi:hypothetical protein
MKIFKYLTLSFIAVLTLVSCETPPPGTVVFDEDSDQDEVVREYLNVDEESLEGYNIIKITTTAVRNPQDSTEVYVPHYQRRANFK